MQNTSLNYKTLGLKTFFMIVIKKLLVLFVIIIALVILSTLIKFLPSVISKTISPDFVGIFDLVNSFIIIIAIITFIFVTVTTWLEYIHYSITLDSHDISITRGVFNIEKIGIPYRRIQQIRINRSLFDQILGITSVVITVLGMSEEGPGSNRSIIVLPYIDTKIATNIQNFVLSKAEVEEVESVKK